MNSAAAAFAAAALLQRMEREKGCCPSRRCLGDGMPLPQKPMQAALRRGFVFPSMIANGGTKKQPTCRLLHSIVGSRGGRASFSHSTHSRTVDFCPYLTYNQGMEEDQDRLAEVIGKNIMRLRKMAGLTQSELAEKLNYSDKSVSKWEQGNGIPDVRILMHLSALFGVTLDELVHEPKNEVIMPKRFRFKQRIITLLCAVGLCWLTAVVLYVFLGIFGKGELPHTWLVFLYAVAASSVVVLVFSAVWKWKWVRIISLTVLIWSVLGCIFLTAFVFGQNIWLIFLIGIPLQILALFFFVWRRGARFKE